MRWKRAKFNVRHNRSPFKLFQCWNTDSSIIGRIGKQFNESQWTGGGKMGKKQFRNEYTYLTGEFTEIEEEKIEDISMKIISLLSSELEQGEKTASIIDHIMNNVKDEIKLNAKIDGRVDGLNEMSVIGSGKFFEFNGEILTKNQALSMYKSIKDILNDGLPEKLRKPIAMSGTLKVFEMMINESEISL
jgi:hypothetical protein